ncbi:hypothetical protein HDG38_006828 [Paraburkholderia sp. WSM4177]|nr:hypothetical protein [Paraburkholderia sp. WSM4177]
MRITPTRRPDLAIEIARRSNTRLEIAAKIDDGVTGFIVDSVDEAVDAGTVSANWTGRAVAKHSSCASPPRAWPTSTSRSTRSCWRRRVKAQRRASSSVEFF